ncbi:putative DNA damage tolerance protein RHC31 [Glarea lozoyensis 74030]|uniref:Putative DNA damage tolerance protein RHC31 n=1 Tax=Glarea lozoyensis (strain ATCC 74030 / MF5533) TaxID=1104152 RepID=H0EJU7_GLAL7|nr:putative DNA damage tolerance protein RHC31 [Glarea lozoyensis 74030]
MFRRAIVIIYYMSFHIEFELTWIWDTLYRQSIAKYREERKRQDFKEYEIALYDRQIRLWGVQAQEKIRSASILLITLSALSNEIAKNLVLAGISTLTILDSAIVTEADLGAQFFLSQADVGRNRAEAAAPQIRKLNPRVKVVVDTTPEAEVKSDYYSQFDVVIAIDLAPMRLGLINTMTRFYRKRFYAAGLHGIGERKGKQAYNLGPGDAVTKRG